MTIKTFKLYVLSLFLVFTSISLAQEVSYAEVETFFPSSERMKKEDITYGVLNIPESWENSESKNIDLAICILKNQEKNANADAVLFIQGGPGASGIQNISTWLDHPLRKKNDIVLLDLRGTGFSEPRLCPDLGNEILQILAKNQSSEEDEKEKIGAALTCKQELLNKGVDIYAYTSTSIAKDLNALLKNLRYDNWHLYGVSYGTYVAQVYASLFPKDVKSIILDSPIDDITKYYTQNTSNYMRSLSKIFAACSNDPDCNADYSNLESFYFETIDSLNSKPITVEVPKNIVPSKTFTFNSEDFKIIIQQALYKEQFIEIIPLLIYQFHERNETALAKLVPSFSSLLGMDYGVYYAMSCNEVLPFNSKEEYILDATQQKSPEVVLSFYGSDFKLCNQWNTARNDSILSINPVKTLSEVNIPILVFSGGYDPITPSLNGKRISEKLDNTIWIDGSYDGHTPSFSNEGNSITTQFIAEPNSNLSNHYFGTNRTEFVDNIVISEGVSNMSETLDRMELLFLIPLAIALLILVFFSALYIYKLIRGDYEAAANKWVRVLVVIISVFGLFIFSALLNAIFQVVNGNELTLAFGFFEKDKYLLDILPVFVVFVGIALLFFLIRIKKITDRSVVFTALFSNLLLVVYFFYWSFF